ncbi:MAG: Flp pilus assembly complex ATPase component TadA [Lentisphaeria bacterium]|nr:Flp pilus assembly complex ATPase component TadA [Lentisphaeria bacterium]
MRCENCQHEFPIYDARMIGNSATCPSCGTSVVCSDRPVIIYCPECKQELECALWMLGSTAECSFCGREIQLTRPASDTGSHTNSYLPPGYKLGSYSIISCIGVGGMGEVYLAHHDLLDRRCALKLLLPSAEGTVANVSLDALVKEAKLACRIRCPNVVEVIDVQVDQQRNFGYIVMEFVQGTDVEHMINDKPMNEDSVINIARGVALALLEASKFQIVHRDIKPGNIMITNTGEIKLADLGIAKSGKDENDDSSGKITGTVHYASPEQLRQVNGGDARSDIYSLGATMYHMLSGKRPFEGDSLKEILTKVLKARFLPIEQAAPHVSRQTCQLVNSMMAYFPEKRPQNAKELLQELDKITAIRSGKVSLRSNLFDFNKIKKFVAAKKRQIIITLSILGTVLLLALAAAAIAGTSSPKVHQAAAQTAAKVEKKPAQPPKMVPGDYINFIKFLILVVWVLSGIRVLKYLDSFEARQSELALNCRPYLNLASLIAGPLVFLAVKFDEKYTDRVRAFMKKLEKLPCIIDSQGNMTYQEDEYAEDFEVIHFLRQLIANALKQHAGEIIIEPHENESSIIRFRVDGILRDIDTLDSEFAYMFSSAVRAISGMNVSDRYRSQNGTFSITGLFGDISFTTSAGRGFNGEKLSLRIIDTKSVPLTVADMNISGRELIIMENTVRLPSGLILVCGPQDSGRTTSLYAMLNSMDHSSRRIVSIETVIERVIPGVKQLKINDFSGKTLAGIMREAILMNPDVICLCDINDEETAQLAIQYAQSGHLVVAAMNTSDKVAVFERLMNFNIPLHTIARSLRAIISQRLVRKLCKCKKHKLPTQDQQFAFTGFELSYSSVYGAGSCSRCGKSGYSGRTAIFDIMGIDDELRLMLEDKNADLSNIQRLLEKSGRNHGLLRSGYTIAAKGITSVEEVERVIMEL